MIHSLIGGLFPIFSIIIASLTATIFGCDLDEGGIHFCVFPGLGDLLYTMGVLGWLAMISIPLGIIGLFLGGLIYVIDILRTPQAPPELPKN